MRMGIFEGLPDELLERICWYDHRTKMKEIFAFIMKYVPDPYDHPARFLRYYTAPEFLQRSARMYSINPVGKTDFHNKHTRIETLLIHHMIS